MHRLLAKQLKRVYQNAMPEDEQFSKLLSLIEASYCQNDQQQGILERSLDLSCTELEQQNNVLSTILNTLPDMTLWVNEVGLVKDIRFGQMKHFFNKAASDYVHLEDLEILNNHYVWSDLITQYQTQNSLYEELSFQFFDQKLVWSVRVKQVTDKRWLFVFRDITIEKQQLHHQQVRLEQLNQNQHKLQRFLDTTPTGVLIFNFSGRLLIANQFVIRFLNLKHANISEKDLLQHLSGASVRAFLKAFQNACEVDYQAGFEQLDLTLLADQHGNTRYIEVRFSPIEIERERVMVVSLVDITERKQLEQQLLILAEVDPLTELYNRRAFNSKSQGLIEQRLKNQKGVAVLLADIDHFKRINDTYGHSVGDKVISTCAELLKKETGSKGVIGRYGGEEFVITLSLDTFQLCQAHAEHLLQKIRLQQIQLDNQAISITVSFGLVFVEKLTAETELEKLIREADACLYKSKQTGRDRLTCHFF